MVKRYKLNNDFSIECITEVKANGSRLFAVRVIMIGVWFEPVMEEYCGICDPKKANDIFIMLRNKYAEGINIGRHT